MKAGLKEALEQIIDKTSNKTLLELNAIKYLKVLSNDVVDIKIELDDLLNMDDVKRSIAKVVKLEFSYPGLKIIIEETFKNTNLSPKSWENFRGLHLDNKTKRLVK